MLAALPLLAIGVLGARIAKAAPPLKVGAALPDPPFELVTKDGPAGFDITLMQRIADKLGPRMAAGALPRRRLQRYLRRSRQRQL